MHKGSDTRCIRTMSKKYVVCIVYCVLYTGRVNSGWMWCEGLRRWMTVMCKMHETCVACQLEAMRMRWRSLPRGSWTWKRWHWERGRATDATACMQVLGIYSHICKWLCYRVSSVIVIQAGRTTRMHFWGRGGRQSEVGSARFTEMNAMWFMV